MLTIRAERFDLDSFLKDGGEGRGRVRKVVDFETVEDFAHSVRGVRGRGSADRLASAVASHLAQEDASVFVPFASGPADGPFARCADGVRRRLLGRDDLDLAENDALGYLITRRSDDFEFTPVECPVADSGAVRAGAEVIAVPMGNRYWHAMRSYARRFERRDAEEIRKTLP